MVGDDVINPFLKGLENPALSIPAVLAIPVDVHPNRRKADLVTPIGAGR